MTRKGYGMKEVLPFQWKWLVKIIPFLGCVLQQRGLSTEKFGSNKHQLTSINWFFNPFASIRELRTICFAASPNFSKENICTLQKVNKERLQRKIKLCKSLSRFSKEQHFQLKTKTVLASFVILNKILLFFSGSSNPQRRILRSWRVRQALSEGQAVSHNQKLFNKFF